MEKNRKDSRIFKFHMKYPAPYSQSWAGIGHPRRSFLLDKSSSKTINSINPSTVARGSLLNAQPRFTGLDPTVAHLKYGLFPNKINISRGQSRILTIKPSVRTTVQTDDYKLRPNSPRKRCITETRRLRIERPAIAKASTVQKFLNPSRSTGEDGPVFVFRPLEHRNLRSLTVSASTHLDIKPRPARYPPRGLQFYTD